jgi:hypothetical protein
MQILLFLSQKGSFFQLKNSFLLFYQNKKNTKNHLFVSGTTKIVCMQIHVSFVHLELGRPLSLKKGIWKVCCPLVSCPPVSCPPCCPFMCLSLSSFLSYIIEGVKNIRMEVELCFEILKLFFKKSELQRNKTQ